MARPEPEAQGRAIRSIDIGAATREGEPWHITKRCYRVSCLLRYWPSPPCPERLPPRHRPERRGAGEPFDGRRGDGRPHRRRRRLDVEPRLDQRPLHVRSRFGHGTPVADRKALFEPCASGCKAATGGEPGVSPIPELAIVHKTEGSPWTWGVGVFGIAGFQTNYPASLTNPVLTPQPPNGIGLGRISSLGGVLSGRADDLLRDQRKALGGIAPTLTIAQARHESDGLRRAGRRRGIRILQYPTADGTRYHFGGGFQVGVYYTPTETWNLGFCFKSPAVVRDLHRQRDQRVGTAGGGSGQFRLSADSFAGHRLHGRAKLALRLRCALFQLRRHGRLRQPGRLRTRRSP